MAVSPWQAQWPPPPPPPAAFGAAYTWDQFDVFRSAAETAGAGLSGVEPAEAGLSGVAPGGAGLGGDELGAAGIVDGFSDVRYSVPRYRETVRRPYGNAAANVSSLAFWMTTLGLINSRYLETAALFTPKDETPPFKTRFKWKTVDFEFLSPLHRRHALASGLYIPENVLPLGLETYGSRLWVSLPRWRPGVPATLATVSLRDEHASPRLAPYPDWTFHAGVNASGGCGGLTSVFRLAADPCGRLWVLDSGRTDILGDSMQTCPPALFLFDLATDRLLAKFTLPKRLAPEDSLYSSIAVDSDEHCSDVHVYLGDPWRFGLVVFREADRRFWRFSHHLFFPDPFASNYTLHGLNFQWTDGLFSLALTPVMASGERRLYFHAMSSFNEFYVSTAVLKDPLAVDKSAAEFHSAGEDRGPHGQSSTAVIDERGVMFNGLVTRDTIGCWDTSKPYRRDLLGVVARDRNTLVFPNDLKLDQRSKSLWVLSNRLPMFQQDRVDFEEYNYRVMYADAEEAVRGTVCDPRLRLPYLSFLIY